MASPRFSTAQTCPHGQDTDQDHLLGLKQPQTQYRVCRPQLDIDEDREKHQNRQKEGPHLGCGEAGQETLSVNLEPTEEKVTLTVHDDGVGFDVQRQQKANDYGLKGMQERAQMAGGELTVTSRPGEGTTVKLVV